MRKLLFLGCLCALAFTTSVAQTPDITDGPEFCVSKTATSEIVANIEICIILGEQWSYDVLVASNPNTPYTIVDPENPSFCFMGKEFRFYKTKDSRGKYSHLTYFKSSLQNSLNNKNQYIANSMARWYRSLKA